MSSTAEKVVMESLALPVSLRAFIAEKLIESLDAPDSPPLSSEWRVELRRRCAALDRATAALRDANAVFAEAYATLA